PAWFWLVSFSSPPILFLQASGSRTGKVLCLDPMLRSAGLVGRALALGDDPLAAKSASVKEDEFAIFVLQMAVKLDAAAAQQEALQFALAHLDGLPPQVRAVQLQKVEGEQDRVGLDTRPVAQEVEHG